MQPLKILDLDKRPKYEQSINTTALARQKACETLTPGLKNPTVLSGIAKHSLIPMAQHCCQQNLRLGNSGLRRVCELGLPQLV